MREVIPLKVHRAEDGEMSLLELVDKFLGRWYRSYD